VDVEMKSGQGAEGVELKVYQIDKPLAWGTTGSPEREEE
jgi:hypothetical protein